MKSNYSWNRREFIAKPAAMLAASQLLGGANLLLGQSAQDHGSAAAVANGKPIHRTLGKTGIRLPIVSMGVMNADIPGLLQRSYELGIRHFDTAAVYQQGRNEEMVGRMIKQMGMRDKVIISTKAGLRFSRERNDASISAAADVKARFIEIFDGSLKRLQMDHVDILYNHGADSEAAIHAEGALDALTALKKEGKTRFIGFSSHRPEMALREAVKVGVYDVVLITFNYTMANDAGLLTAIDEAAAKGIGIVAMKTQAGGASRPDPKLARPLLPASQTALLKWVLHHEAVTTAIPGYTTYEQMEQNFSVAPDIAYTPEERDFLAGKTVAADAQFCHQCGQCRPDCPLGVDIPQLMRSHMYAVQYANYQLAAETMAAISEGSGISSCSNCESCRAECRNSVNIARKIQHLKEISSIGRFAV